MREKKLTILRSYNSHHGVGVVAVVRKEAEGNNCIIIYCGAVHVNPTSIIGISQKGVVQDGCVQRLKLEPRKTH